jgi:hypothetical protein
VARIGDPVDVVGKRLLVERDHEHPTHRAGRVENVFEHRLGDAHAIAVRDGLEPPLRIAAAERNDDGSHCPEESTGGRVDGR